MKYELNTPSPLLAVGKKGKIMISLFSKKFALGGVFVALVFFESSVLAISLEELGRKADKNLERLHDKIDKTIDKWEEDSKPARKKAEKKLEAMSKEADELWVSTEDVSVDFMEDVKDLLEKVHESLDDFLTALDQKSIKAATAAEKNFKKYSNDIKNLYKVSLKEGNEVTASALGGTLKILKRLENTIEDLKSDMEKKK